jgi:hypothetical protein
MATTSTVKISQLPSASAAGITSATDVLPIIDGNITKQITVDNLFGTATDITASGNISSSGTITAVTGAFSHLIGNSPITVASQLKFGGQSGTADINLGINESGGDVKLLNANDIPLIDPIIGNTFTVGIQGSGRTEFGGAHEVELYARGAVKILSTDGNQNGIGSYILMGSASISSDIANTDQHTIRFGSGSGGNLGHHPTIGDFYGGTDTVVFNTAKGHITASGNISASSILGTLGTAAQTNITSLGTLTALTVDNISINATTISSTSDTDVSLILNTSGIFFEANTGDKFHFNQNQNNADFMVFGQNDENLIYVDASADKVGIGTATPTAKLDVAGNIRATSHITASGNISASGNIIATSGSFQYITSSVIDVNANTIRIGGTSFSKTDIDNLKGGKSISTNSDKQVIHGGDDSTFVQMKASAPGRVIHKISNVSLFDMQTSSFAIGDDDVPVVLQGSSISITGSTSNTGSFNQSGSTIFTGSFEQSGSTTFTGGGFVVNDLLNLLANFGGTGLPTGSGEGGVSSGDINLDGQVNITDLLLLLAGMGNPNIITSNLTVPLNTNHQLIGPEITVSQSIVLTIPTGSVLSIT